MQVTQVYASAYKKYGNLNMCKKNFSVIEETKSST